MTFDASESSVQDGIPIELWVFQVYGVNYRYTTAAEDYTHFASTYLARAISHSAFEETSQVKKNTVTLYVPRDFEILRFYESMPPSDVILLTVFQVHRGDTDAISAWTGRVMGSSRQKRTGELYCENIYTSLKRMGLRRPYSRQCPHVLYDPNSCKADEALFEFTAIVDSVSGLQVQSTAFAAYPDGRLAGGVLEYEPTPGQIERRGIKSHVGNLVEMTHPIDDLQTLAQLRGLPGCKHNLADCDGFFDNVLNYGGTPFIPQKNPMGNNSVF
jgi:uncharacterized phage protein (TIGR02218 family)